MPDPTQQPPTVDEAVRRKGIALDIWTDFIDANPSGVTSPTEYPNHGLITADELHGLMEEFARASTPAPAAPSEPVAPIYVMSTHFGGPWHQVTKEKYDSVLTRNRTILYAAPPVAAPGDGVLPSVQDADVFRQATQILRAALDDQKGDDNPSRIVRNAVWRLIHAGYRIVPFATLTATAPAAAQAGRTFEDECALDAARDGAWRDEAAQAGRRDEAADARRYRALRNMSPDRSFPVGDATGLFCGLQLDAAIDAALATSDPATPDGGDTA